MAPKYIDLEHCDVEINEVGFLVESVREGVSTWSLRTRPVAKNQSGERIVSGWAGETDNVSRYARGLARALVRSPNDRVQIEPVDPYTPEGHAALETLCFPELAP